MAGRTRKRAFTDLAVEQMRPPRAGRLEIADSLMPGLVLRVTERGTKTWAVIYKVPGERGVSPGGRPLRGVQHRITLGTYPFVKVKAARTRALEILEQVGTGVDPRAAHRADCLARHANTVEAVSKRMIELAKNQIEGWRKIEMVLESHVWPRWGTRPLGEITRADVHSLLDELVADNRHGAAREVRKHLSRLMNYAVEKAVIPANPMADMRRPDLTHTPSERVLSDAELRGVWTATAEMGYPFGDAIRLLLLTGQRKSEWFRAMRSEIDASERLLVIPRERYKGRRGHVVPLVGEAWRIVEGLPEWRGDDCPLFSTTGGRNVISGDSQAKARLLKGVLKHMQKVDKNATLPPFTLHDLRRTCETRLARLGHNQEVRDAILGHAKDVLQRTYNKYDYLEEKRSALLSYSDHIMGIVG